MKKGILLLGISLSFALAFECKDYTVRKGDSLEKIAKREGVSLESLKKANKNIDERQLKVGQKLCIPVKSAKKATSEKYAIYEVKKGDTLQKIAESFGVDVEDLKEFNGLKDEKIVEGQKIKIPAPKAISKKKGEDKDYELYTIKRGGRLKDVAKATGVPLKELEKLNPDLKGKFLSAGTKVKIPKDATQAKKEESKREEDYQFYTVKRGARLKDVAKATGISLKELEKLNPELKDRWLKAGTKVKIPKSSIEAKSGEGTKEEGYAYYRVKRKVKLEHVAKATGTSLKELERLNPDLKDKWLSPGTKVKIPVKEAKRTKEEGNYDFYTVKRSGRLRDVARATGVPLKELEKLNPELKGKLLKAGTKVKIPKQEVASKPVQKEMPKKDERNKEDKYIVKDLEKENNKTSASLPRNLNILPPVEGKISKVPKGVEIHAPCSAPVKAVEDGRVIYSGGDLQAYGNMVIIEHDNFISLYAYNETNLVKRGERVSKGQTIAKVGKKNNSDECMLRFEIRNKEGIPLDPTEYIKDIQ